MSRRRRAVKRIIAPDPKYNSLEIANFINRIMKNGKKSVAQRVLYQALDMVSKEASRKPIEIFQQALHNSTPAVEVKARRVGGATYQVPVEVGDSRRMALAMRWIIRAAQGRGGRPMAEKLAQELLEASKGQSAAVKRKEDLHKMAEANRAFAHYRW